MASAKLRRHPSLALSSVEPCLEQVFDSAPAINRSSLLSLFNKLVAFLARSEPFAERGWFCERIMLLRIRNRIADESSVHADRNKNFGKITLHLYFRMILFQSISGLIFCSGAWLSGA